MRQAVRFCTAPDGVRIAYAIHGTGPPLVRTATWLTHLEFDWESPVWRHWLEGLADGNTVLRYDERGCGLSDHDVEDLSLDARVADLEAVIRASGFEQVDLLGMSQSGPVAVAYAARHPERVSRLVLFSTYARGRLLRDPSPSAREHAELMISLIRMGWGQDQPAFRRLFTTLFIPDDAGADELVRRAPARDDRARDRGSHPARPQPRRGHARGDAGGGADARAARARRRARAVLRGAPAGHADPGGALRRAREPQPHPAGGRAGVGGVPRRAARLPRSRGGRAAGRAARHERPRARGAGARRRGPQQRGDRGAPLPERQDGRAPSLQHLRQAASVWEGRARRGGGALLALARPVRG